MKELPPKVTDPVLDTTPRFQGGAIGPLLTMTA
jgi:hypothetical protein